MVIRVIMTVMGVMVTVVMVMGVIMTVMVMVMTVVMVMGMMETVMVKMTLVGRHASGENRELRIAYILTTMVVS